MIINKVNQSISFGWNPFRKNPNKNSESKSFGLIEKYSDIKDNLPDEFVYTKGLTTSKNKTFIDGRKANVDETGREEKEIIG